jgi:hypothetical protein
MPKNLSAPPAEILTESINHRVNLYSAAAVAAGVSMLALAQPADAEVVVTKANLPITHLASVSLDLNKDGIADFQFSLYTFAYHSFFADLTVQGLTGGEVVGSPGSRGAYASALIRGAKIGPSAHFSSDNGFASIERSHGAAISSTFYSRHTYGKWGDNPPNRFLGVKFLINGATHYGWVRLTVISAPRRPISATITGYAYETIPNKHILAGIPPKPSADTQAQQEGEKPGRPSLGMLALGVDGLALWRREETLTS